MQIPVVVESLGDDQFRAQAPPPISLVAEGKSSEEAVRNLQARILQEYSRDRRIVLLDLPIDAENPWIKFAGHLKDDSFLSDFRQSLAEYRQQRDPDDE
jgi:hypothetical protein